MGEDWLEHQLTPAEAASFARDGYFIVPDALLAKEVERLADAVERVRDLVARAHGVPRTDSFNLIDFMGLDQAFIDLVDHPTTFPKLWTILGWNMQIYHSHLIVTPSLQAPDTRRRKHFLQSQRPRSARSDTVASDEDWWGWHRDSGQINGDLGDGLQPRLSVKIAYYLSDALGDTDANMWVAPGSHVDADVQAGAAYAKSAPPGAIPVRTAAGSAVFFDRRIVHSSSPNFGSHTRKVLFYGYSHRWVRPRDDMTVGAYLARSDPIRRQLLGHSESAFGYSSPGVDDVPLRSWLEERGISIR
jgi:hypothetical protein